MKIGELARRTGVRVQTIRYYEQIGLLPEPPRRESGYRKFGEEDIRRLQFIQRAKRLGFSLKEIKELLELRMTPDTPPEAFRRRVERKMRRIEAQIGELQEMHAALGRLANQCLCQSAMGPCPILRALEGEEVL